MCLHPEEVPAVPDETVRVAKAAFPKGNLYMRLRDALTPSIGDSGLVAHSAISYKSRFLIESSAPWG